jgi:acetyltransferase-like isoleucine patch superfamily enzyme
MFRRLALRIRAKREQKELLAACQNSPTNLRTFGKTTAKWGVQIVLGDHVTLGNNVVFYGDGKVTIGNNVYINDGVMIFASKESGVSIGSGTAIAPYCYITDTDHGTKKESAVREQQNTHAPVEIGKECWLGAHVCILKGSIVHDGAIIGAGAVVKGEIPESAIAVGVPAKVIKFRQ